MRGRAPPPRPRAGVRDEGASVPGTVCERRQRGVRPRLRGTQRMGVSRREPLCMWRHVRACVTASVCVCGAERVGDGEQRMREQPCVCDPPRSPPVPCAGACRGRLGLSFLRVRRGHASVSLDAACSVTKCKKRWQRLSQILQRGGGGISPGTSNIQDH